MPTVDDDPNRTVEDGLRRHGTGAPTPESEPDLTVMLKRLQVPRRPEAPVDLDTVTRVASDSAAALWRAGARASADIAGWQPDGRALQRVPPRDPRLLVQWQPDAWVVAAQQVAEARTEVINSRESGVGPIVETHAPLRLVLAWRPARRDRPQFDRWPHVVRLVEADDAQVAAALVANVPAPDPLWRAPDDTIDWALSAEIALLHDASLPAWKADALRTFIDRRREADFGRANIGYVPWQAGGARRRDG